MVPLHTVHDIVEDGRRAFRALEFLDGKTLKEVVQEGPPETSRLVSIAIPMLGGLEAAAGGILHRDIKLANIFVTRQGRVKIVDFGLAKVTSRRYASVGVGLDAADDRFTTGGARLGTMAYMSPEQALGKALDQRTDLFSFGIVVYQMATGRAPFHGDTTGVLFLSIVQENPTPARELNPAIPDELQRIISKCLEKGTRPRLSAGVRHTFRPESAAQRAEFELAIEAEVAEEEDRIAAVAMPGAKSRAPSARQERVTVGTLMHENLGAKPARWAWKVMTTVVGLVLLAGAGGLFLKSRRVGTLQARDSMVIAEFANATADRVFDGTLHQAVAVDLAQSSFLNVVSDRVIAASLKQMEKPANERLSRSVAREVCLRTNSKAMVAGSIAPHEQGCRIQGRGSELFSSGG